MGWAAPSLAVLNLRRGHSFILNGFQNTLMTRENLCLGPAGVWTRGDMVTGTVAKLFFEAAVKIRQIAEPYRIGHL